VQTKRVYQILVEHCGTGGLGKRGCPNLLEIFGHAFSARLLKQNQMGHEGMYLNESNSAINGMGRVAA
jgi:hypothetical protein